MMRTETWLPALLLAGLAATVTAAAPAPDDEALPRPFVAAYQVRALGFSGESTMQLAATDEPGVFVFRTEARPKGLARLFTDEQSECSLFRYEDGRFLPLAYREQDEDRPSQLRFDWRRGTALARYRDSEATLELEPGTLDRATEQIAVMRDLAATPEPPGPYRTIERNEYRDIEYRPEGREKIDSPVGSYETVLFRRQRVGSRRSVLLWYAPGLDWMPVKIQQFKGEKSQATAYLQRYEPAAGAGDQARGNVTPVCP